MVTEDDKKWMGSFAGTVVRQRAVATGERVATLHDYKAIQWIKQSVHYEASGSQQPSCPSTYMCVYTPFTVVAPLDSAAAVYSQLSKIFSMFRGFLPLQ